MRKRNEPLQPQFQPPVQPQQEANGPEAVIHQTEQAMAVTLRQIGERYVSLHKGDYEADFADLFEKLADQKRRIDLCKALILERKGLRKCPSCGAEIPLNSIFCNMCGQPMKEKNDPPRQPEAPAMVDCPPEPEKLEEPVQPEAPEVLFPPLFTEPVEEPTVAPPEAPVSAEPTCTNCGATLRSGVMFCESCGAPRARQQPPASPANPVCPKCGNPVKPGARFCTSCGNPM